MHRGVPITTFAHISDLHATPVAPESLRPLIGKRLLGWISWRLRRGAIHRPEVLEALVADLRETSPDQIVITGDLTNVSLESEFASACEWLRRIGNPERVTLVPGNHDAYVRVPVARSWALWSEYLLSDAAGRDLLGRDESKPGGLDFPSVRIRGRLAIVGVSSAVPTAPFLASGRVGSAQLERLERVLAELAVSDLCRVILIHHPPVPGVVSRRRALRDAEAFGAVLRCTGAELVLHGHLHRTYQGSLPGPDGPVPVAGVRAASEIGSKPGKCAQYQLYELLETPRAGSRPGFQMHLQTRAYDPRTHTFQPLPANRERGSG